MVKVVKIKKILLIFTQKTDFLSTKHSNLPKKPIKTIQINTPSPTTTQTPTDEFILKITVPKVAEKVSENGNVTENYRLDKGGSLYFDH